ncbi:MAG TPA: hypothetical protein VFZ76_11620 [Anaerolineales bacterium]
MAIKRTINHPSSAPAGSQREISYGTQANQDISVFLPGFHHGGNRARGEDRLIIPDRIPVTPTRRLVVLIPDGDLDHKSLVNRIWELASTSGLNVLFLALSPGQNEVAYLRRHLADLAAMTNYGHVGASTKIIVAGNWTQAVAEILHAGDLLVCMAKHRVAYRVLGRKILGELLSSSFNVPVYLLGGLLIGTSRRRQKLIREILAWLVFLAVIAGFSSIQIWIDQGYGKPLSTILLCISVVFELLLIFIVNEWMV